MQRDGFRLFGHGGCECHEGLRIRKIVKFIYEL